MVTRWCSGYHARLVLRGDASSNPARDTNFSFISETCRKPLVSDLHLSFLVSKAFVAQNLSCSAKIFFVYTKANGRRVFEERVLKTPFSLRIRVDDRRNRQNKTAFSKKR